MIKLETLVALREREREREREQAFNEINKIKNRINYQIKDSDKNLRN